MNTKRKGLWAVVIALVAGLICLVVFLLSRGLSPPTVEKPTKLSPHSEAKRAEKSLPLPGSRTAETPEQARTSFGVLLWPGMTGRAMNYSRQILSWMKEWGFDAGFVTVERDGSGGESSSAFPADVAENTWTFSEVSSRLNAMVVADGDLSDSQALALKEYLMSGGWVIVPSPEDGGASSEVEELLQLKPSRSATLMAPEEPQSESPLGAEEVRVLTSHPLLSGVAMGSWLEWTGPPGQALYSKVDEALPLLCFRRPELPAMRLIPFGEGGVVHWNFPLRPGPLIEEIELKAFLGDTLTWLWGRATWAEPVEKGGTALGIVRKKDGTPIPAAKVTAKVFSESGEAAQTLETTSSEDGKFSLSVFNNAIYWVKADAEGYYQANMYLLARPQQKEGVQIEVLMEPEGSIFGQAYYGPREDHPAVGISVTLAPNCRISSAWEKETVTDGNARFSFNHLPAAQTFYLIAKAEGWMGLQEAPVPLEGGYSEVDVHLESLVGANGTTTNAVTGAPVSGAEVLARPWQDEGARFLFLHALTVETTSGTDGNFVLMLPCGHWRVTAEAQGFTAMPKNPGAFDVSVSESRSPEPPEIVVELCPDAALFGTVFTSSGKPAPRAKVTVDSGTITWADDKGCYKTAPLRPAFVVTPRSPGFNVGAEWKNESASGLCSFELTGSSNSYAELLQGASPLDLHLQAPATKQGLAVVFGTVLDENGEQASSSEIELAEPSRSPGPWSFCAAPLKKTLSGADGEFQFLHVGKGLWLIRARKERTSPGGKCLLLGEKWQTLVEDVPVPSVQVRLSKAYIRGRVQEADGSSMRNRYLDFSLTLHTGHEGVQELFLGEYGEFTLFPPRRAVLTRPSSTAMYRRWAEKRWPYPPGVKVAVPWEKPDLPEEGYVRLSVRSREGLTADLGNIQWGEESLVVSLPRRGRVRGQVIDADTRNPIADAGIGASYAGRYFKGGVTDGSGMFSLSNMPAGFCEVGVHVDGYWHRRKRVEVIEAGEVYLELEIWTYWTIRGRLLLKDTGDPVVTEVRTRHGTYVSGRDGRFAISVPAKKGEIAFWYEFTIPLEGSGLKAVSSRVEYNPFAREIDVGDVYVEKENELNSDGGEVK